MDWNVKEIELVSSLLLLTSKPIIYLVNLCEEDYLRQRNKWLAKIAQWVKEHSPGATVIPFSLPLEVQCDSFKTKEERADFLVEKSCKSQLDKIIRTGFDNLQLINFFTAGSDEVKAWPVQRGSLAPRAAGTIHTDFENFFIKAEVMKFPEFREIGDEGKVKAAGKYRTEGKTYEVEDGDIILFKHNAGGSKRK